MDSHIEAYSCTGWSYLASVGGGSAEEASRSHFLAADAIYRTLMLAYIAGGMVIVLTNDVGGGILGG